MDAALYPVGATGPLFLAAIEVKPRAATLVLADARTPRLATAAFDPLAGVDSVEFLDAVGRTAGKIVVDTERLPAFQAWPTARHELGQAAAEFCPAVVVPLPAGGVEGLLLEDGTLLTGDVWLVAEDGVVFTDTGDAGGNVIRVDVIGDPLFRRRLCRPADLFQTPRFIKTINGVAPSDQGDFHLLVGGHLAETNILRVYPRDGVLVIEAVGQPTEGT